MSIEQTAVTDPFTKENEWVIKLIDRLETIRRHRDNLRKLQEQSKVVGMNAQEFVAKERARFVDATLSWLLGEDDSIENYFRLVDEQVNPKPTPENHP